MLNERYQRVIFEAFNGRLRSKPCMVDTDESKIMLQYTYDGFLPVDSEELPLKTSKFKSAVFTYRGRKDPDTGFMIYELTEG